jgi:hypothetical protein
MIKINRGFSLQPLVFATALPLAFLAAGLIPVYAAVVSVTGANGANGERWRPGHGHATSIDPSNSAAATGGNGGIGGAGGATYPPGGGGHGGAASSTAIASSANGSSATATSTGGNGGRGGLPNPCIHTCIPGAGGGGAASAISSAAGGGAFTVVSDATATGGAALISYNNPPAGTASASASATSTGSGLVEANASAFDPTKFTGEYYGETGDRASATASAQNESGSIVTTASAPRGSTASALSSAAVGSVSESLVTIFAGHAVSDAALTPGGGLTIGVGAMSVGYGATSFGITYDATAVFDFTTSPKEEALDLSRFSSNSVPSTGLGFDNLLLWVDVDGNDVYSFSTTSLSAADTFFAPGHSLPLGTIATGKHSIEIEYSLTYNSGTAAASGDGFGFTYALMDPPLNIPETSTWAMMLFGFAGLAFASYRASRKGARKALRSSSLSTPSILGGVFSFPPAVS